MSSHLISELERERSYSDGMAAAAKMWMHKAQQLEEELHRTVIALVSAAGGEIRVTQHDLVNSPKLELVKTYFPHDITVAFATKPLILPTRKEKNA